MTDRERRDLRGPVKTVTTETLDWDEKAGAVSEKLSRREELTFSPQGSLLESVSQFQNRLIQRCTNVYDDAGRLREIRYRNSDGTESIPSRAGRASKKDPSLTTSRVIDFPSICGIRSKTQ